MTSAEQMLKRELRGAGLTRAAIDAAWPAWWSSDAEQSLSATTELKYTVARRLGIAPASLFDGPPKFVWRDEGKFKNLGTTTEAQQYALTSFGVAVGRALLTGVPGYDQLTESDPLTIRRAILDSSQDVRLNEILSLCWSVGIPVIKTEVFPFQQKRMQAMTVRNGRRHAIIVGRTTRFPAWVTFILAHELGHIIGGHLDRDVALLEMKDPLQSTDVDDEEQYADEFALALLTGSRKLTVSASESEYTGRQVAESAMQTGAKLRIDPGVLTLCLAHNTGRWRQSISALKLMGNQQDEDDVGRRLNSVADQQLDWESVTFEQAEYLARIMALNG